MLDAIDTGPSRGEMEKFPTLQTDGSRSSLLLDASGTKAVDHVDRSREILARETLLLRVATESVLRSGILWDPAHGDSSGARVVGGHHEHEVARVADGSFRKHGQIRACGASR